MSLGVALEIKMSLPFPMVTSVQDASSQLSAAVARVGSHPSGTVNLHKPRLL